MLYGHVFDKISTAFRGILRVFVNFADLPEFRGSATTRNIRSSAKKERIDIIAEKLNAVCFPFFDKQSENFSCRSFLAFQDQHADSLLISFDQFNLVTGLEGGLCRLSVKMCSA